MPACRMPHADYTTTDPFFISSHLYPCGATDPAAVTCETVIGNGA